MTLIALLTSFAAHLGGTLTLGHAAHTVSVTFISCPTVTYGDVFNLLDWTSLTGIDASSLAGGFNVATDFDLSGLGGGLAWDTSAFTRYGILVAAPDPGLAIAASARSDEEMHGLRLPSMTAAHL